MVILWTQLAPRSLLGMGSFCVGVCSMPQERCWMAAQPKGGTGGEAAQDPELCADFLKQYLTWMKDSADPGER